MNQNSYIGSRPVPQLRRRSDINIVEPKRKRPIFKISLLLIVAMFLVWVGFVIVGVNKASADAPIPEIKSGLSGFCIDDYHNVTKPNSRVVDWSCNGTPAQEFSFNGVSIVKDTKYCLDVSGDKVVINKCSNNLASQKWERDDVGFKNKASNKCLSIPSGTSSKQLILSSCNFTKLSETWTPSQWSGKPMTLSSDPSCRQANLGNRVACVAKREWLAWQTEPKLHYALLNDYTDGNANEEWCADFVSFVYKEAGAPFSNGERSGWDEYNANYIQNQGFSYHPANSGYIPKPGDVAYFDYSGGHVEIVVKGGRHPTFIYGDSGTKDPITGNGDMAENQITSNGSAGQVVYYLSPNSSV